MSHEKITSSKLNSVERFHYYSSTSKYPNVLFCKLKIDSVLDRPIFESAAEKMMERQAVAMQSITETRGRLHTACPWPAKPVHVTWLEASNADFQRVENECAQGLQDNGDVRLRVWCVGGSGGTTVLLGVHHTIGDGLGGAQSINNLLAIYDNLRAARGWDQGLRRLDVERLKLRNNLGIGSWDYLKHLWKQPIAIAGLLKFLFRDFSVLSPRKIEQGASSSDAIPLGLVGQWMEADHAAAIDRFAKEKQLTVNSIFMAAVFYAVDKWSSLHAPEGRKRWCRMVLPVSLRSKDDLRLPLTNRATLVQVDRNEDQMQDRDSFLHYLDREVKIIVGWQFHKLFLMIVRCMSVSEAWLRWSARKQKPRGTIVFTNLGEPFRATEKRERSNRDDGGAVTQVSAFDFGGPIRNYMPLNFTLQKSKERYRLSVRFDSRVVTIDQAEEFLAMVSAEATGFSEFKEL